MKWIRALAPGGASLLGFGLGSLSASGRLVDPRFGYGILALGALLMAVAYAWPQKSRAV